MPWNRVVFTPTNENEEAIAASFSSLQTFTYDIETRVGKLETGLDGAQSEIDDINRHLLDAAVILAPTTSTRNKIAPVGASIVGLTVQASTGGPSHRHIQDWLNGAGSIIMSIDQLGVFNVTGKSFAFNNTSLAGGSVFSVANSVNASDADVSQLSISTGGSVAGDPVLLLQIAGVGSAALGLDNSVAGDPVVLSYSTALGTNNIFSAVSSLFSFLIDVSASGKLSLAGNLNINGAVDTANYKVNVLDGYFATTNSFGFRGFGIGNPSLVAAGATEYLEWYHDGAGSNGASINVAKTSTGSLRQLNIRMGGTAYFVLTTTGSVLVGDTSVYSAGIGLGVKRDDGVANGEHFVSEFYRTNGGTAQILLGYRANGSAVTAQLIRAGNSLPLILGTSNSNQAVTIANTGGVSLAATLDVAGLATFAADIALSSANGIIKQTTADGSDNRGVRMIGGGFTSGVVADRGAQVAVFGNEIGGGASGLIFIQPGNVANSGVQVIMNSAFTQNFLIAGVQIPFIVQTGAGGDTVFVGDTATKLQFFQPGAGGAGLQTVTGSRGGNAALASFLTAIANYGLIINSTT